MNLDGLAPQPAPPPTTVYFLCVRPRSHTHKVPLVKPGRSPVGVPSPHPAPQAGDDRAGVYSWVPCVLSLCPGLAWGSPQALPFALRPGTCLAAQLRPPSVRLYHGGGRKGQGVVGVAAATPRAAAEISVLPERGSRAKPYPKSKPPVLLASLGGQPHQPPWERKSPPPQEVPKKYTSTETEVRGPDLWDTRSPRGWAQPAGLHLPHGPES